MEPMSLYLQSYNLYNLSIVSKQRPLQNKVMGQTVNIHSRVKNLNRVWTLEVIFNSTFKSRHIGKELWPRFPTDREDFQSERSGEKYLSSTSKTYLLFSWEWCIECLYRLYFLREFSEYFSRTLRSIVSIGIQIFVI